MFRASLLPLLPVAVERVATCPETSVKAVAEEQPARTATAASEASPSLSFRIFVFGSSAVSLSEVSVQDPAPAVRG